MATFDTLIDDLATRYGLGANARSLVREILAMIANSPGGLAGFLGMFKKAGLSSEVTSWLGRPDASPLAAGQVERALGATVLSGIEGRLGLAHGALATALGYAVPKAVGLLTPGGAVPAGVPAAVTAFLSQPTERAPGRGPAPLRRARPHRTSPASGAGCGPRSARWSSPATWPISGRTGRRPFPMSRRRRSMRRPPPRPSRRRHPRRLLIQRRRNRPLRRRQRRMRRRRPLLPLLRRTRKLRLRRLLRRPPHRLRPRRLHWRLRPRLPRPSQRLNQPRPRPPPSRPGSRSATTMASCVRRASCATTTRRPRSLTRSTESSARTR